MRSPKVHLQLLGPFSATVGARDATGIFAQPKRLAFVTWLALSRPAGLHRRETICALLWPESSEQHSRGALRQLLLVLRRELSEQVFVTEADLIGLNTEVVSSDAGAVFDALERGDDAGAVSLCTGELLPGLHLDEGESFERWIDQRRDELRRGVTQAAWRLVDEAEAKEDLSEARRLAESAFGLEQSDEAGLRRVVALQARVGDRAAALRTYEAFSRRLRQDWSAEPDPETSALMEKIREGGGSANHTLPARNIDVSPQVVGVPPVGVTVPPPETSPSVPRRVTAMVLLMGGLLTAGGAWLAGAWSGRRSVELPTRWSVALPDSAPLLFVGPGGLGLGLPSIAISPDERRVIYVGRQGRASALFVHDLGSFEVRRLAGTEGGFAPFFSPDGSEVAFFSSGRLKRLAVGGGPPVSIADVVEPFGGFWADRDRIVVADREGYRLRTIPLAGGSGTSVPTELVYSPTAIPGSSWVLHAFPSNAGILAVTSLESGETRFITRGGPPTSSLLSPDILYGMRPIYFEGYLLFIAPTSNRLMAVRFDSRALRAEGNPFPVIDGIRVERAGAQFSVSRRTLVYAPGGDDRFGRLVWAYPGGRLDTLPTPAGSFGEFEISPSGNRLVLSIGTTDGPPEIQILDLRDLARGVQEKWRPPARSNVMPHWAPDETAVAFAMNNHPGRWLLRARLPLGSSLDTLATNFMAHTATSDGKSFLGFILDSSGSDLARLSVDSLTTTRLLARPGNQYFASLSPDGAWLSYMSDETGSWEVYVQSYPDLGRRRKVSVAGGEEPIWSPKGDRLFYRYGTTWYVAAVDRRTGVVGLPVEFISGRFANIPGFSYSVPPDGERLLVMLRPPDETASHIRILRDLASELHKAERRR